MLQFNISDLFINKYALIKDFKKYFLPLCSIKMNYNIRI